MLLDLALAAIVVYFVVLGLMWARQERIVFQPPPPMRDTPLVRPGVRQVSYRADDGVELFGYLVGDEAHAKRLLIAFHGNADLASNLIPWAATATQTAPIAVLIPELRGCAGLTGQPTYVGAARDARAAAQFATDSLGVPSGRMVYFGHSLGSAIATDLAAERPPAALVLQSPFSSARDMARRMALPGLTLFWPLVSRVHYDTRAKVAALPVPVSVAHGLRDLVVPARMGREVYDAAAVKGELLLVPGAGHNDVADLSPVEYWNWFRRAVMY